MQKLGFWFHLKFWFLIISLNLVYNESFYHLLYSCILEKSCGSWDMDQNAFCQIECRIFKSAISLEQNDESAWFFTCWYKFMEIKIWLENIGVGIVKYGCGHSVHGTLTLVVFQEGINGITDILHADTNSERLQVTLMIFGWSWSKVSMIF